MATAKEQKTKKLKKPKTKKPKTIKKTKTDKTCPTSSKCVLVTGAAGFVGSHMIEEMIEAGFKVIATDLPKADFSVAQSVGAEIIEADFTNSEALETVFNHRINYVVHVAALYNFEAKRSDLMKVNRDGTRNVAEASLKAGVEHFIYFSTADIHGQPEHTITEDTPVKPLNAYAESKWAGEKQVRNLYKTDGLPLTVIRPTVIYGPRSRYVASNFFCIPGIVYAISKRLNVNNTKLNVFSGGPHVSWIHVRDLTGAVRFMLGKPETIGNAYNVTDDNPMTLEELLSIIFELFDYKWIPTIPYPTSLVAAFARVGMNLPPFVFEIVTKFMQNQWEIVREQFDLTNDIRPSFARDFMSFMLGSRVCDNSRLKKLGYKLRYPDSREGFRETFEWYRANRWLPQVDEIWENKKAG